MDKNYFIKFQSKRFMTKNEYLNYLKNIFTEKLLWARKNKNIKIKIRRNHKKNKT